MQFHGFRRCNWVHMRQRWNLFTIVAVQLNRACVPVALQFVKQSQRKGARSPLLPFSTNANRSSHSFFLNRPSLKTSPLQAQNQRQLLARIRLCYLSCKLFAHKLGSLNSPRIMLPIWRKCHSLTHLMPFFESAF